MAIDQRYDWRQVSCSCEGGELRDAINQGAGDGIMRRRYVAIDVIRGDQKGNVKPMGWWILAPSAADAAVEGYARACAWVGPVRLRDEWYHDDEWTLARLRVDGREPGKEAWTRIQGLRRNHRAAEPIEERRQEWEDRWQAGITEIMRGAGHSCGAGVADPPTQGVAAPEPGDIVVQGAEDTALRPTDAQIAAVLEVLHECRHDPNDEAKARAVLEAAFK